MLNEGNCGFDYNKLGINAARCVTRNALAITDPSARAPSLRSSTLEIVKPAEYSRQKSWFFKRGPFYLLGPEEQAAAAAAIVRAGNFAGVSEQSAQCRRRAAAEDFGES